MTEFDLRACAPASVKSAWAKQIRVAARALLDEVPRGVSSALRAGDEGTTTECLLVVTDRSLILVSDSDATVERYAYDRLDLLRAEYRHNAGTVEIAYPHGQLMLTGIDQAAARELVAGLEQSSQAPQTGRTPTDHSERLGENPSAGPPGNPTTTAPTLASTPVFAQDVEPHPLAEIGSAWPAARP